MSWGAWGVGGQGLHRGAEALGTGLCPLRLPARLVSPLLGQVHGGGKGSGGHVLEGTACFHLLRIHSLTR